MSKNELKCGNFYSEIISMQLQTEEHYVCLSFDSSTWAAVLTVELLDTIRKRIFNFGETQLVKQLFGLIIFELGLIVL